MTAPAIDWAALRLVVFDIDGTLYRQSGMRRRMAAALLWHAATRLDARTPRLLRHYRKCREDLGAAETPDLEARARADTATALGTDVATVATTVEDWMDRRPLPHLAGLRYRGLVEVFAGLRRAGIPIGVLSDFPATAKLDALGLQADLVAAANDPEIGRAKPHPKGLETLIARAGATPAATLMIGDRPERDGAAARRAGAQILIRSDTPLPGWPTVAGFEDPVFAALTG